MSHVHAFSCIRTLISLYSYILMYLVLFFVCVSLSLFLSLSCIMEPKRKSVSSQNSLRSGASTSSSDPTPSSVRFRDEKACKNFLENFSRRGIHLERQVIVSDFSNINLPTVIYSRGWESLFGIHVPFRDHTGVLLQYAWIWLLYTPVCHSCSGYTHCSYSGSYIRGTTRSKGKATWLP